MIKLIKHKDIDKQKWDKCIGESINGLVFGYSWFLDITSPKSWEGLIEMEIVDGNVFYISVFPIEYRRKAGIKYAYQSPFVVETDIFSIKPLTDQERSQFYDVLINHYKYIAKLIFSDQVKLPFPVKKHDTYIINFKQSYESIFAQYKYDRKKDIRKAARQQLKIKYSEDYQKLIDLINQYILPKYDFSVIANVQDTWEKLVKACLVNKKGLLLHTFKDDTDLDFSFYTISKNRIHRYLCVATPEGRKSGAATFSIDYLIKTWASNNCQLDFVGIHNDNLHYFKSSFGGDVHHYQEISINNFPFYIKKLMSLRKRML